MLEIAFQMPTNSKFPGVVCHCTPLEIPRAFGAHLHAPVSKILDSPLTGNLMPWHATENFNSSAFYILCVYRYYLSNGHNWFRNRDRPDGKQCPRSPSYSYRAYDNVFECLLQNWKLKCSSNLSNIKFQLSSTVR